MPTARHRRLCRLLRLSTHRTRARVGRFLFRWITMPLVHASTWTYLAAGAFVGFEVLEVVLGAFVLAPEVVPLVLLGLAVQGVLRAGIRRGRRLFRLWRLRRRHPRGGGRG